MRTEYILNKHFDKNAIQKDVREANILMDLLWSHDILEEKDDDPRLIQSFGISYQVVEVRTGVIKEHIRSEACCTFICEQFGSSPDMYICEATGEFLRNYIQVLRNMCKEQHLK